MAEFTPNEIVRLGLERALVSDAIARQKKAKRLDNAILPTFMGANGRIKRMGHGDSRALIIPNLQFTKGEEMLATPVKGGLPAVDNRSYFAPLPAPPAPTPPPPETRSFFVNSNLEQFTVESDDLNAGGGIGSNSYGVPYLLPSKTLDSAGFASYIELIGFPIIQDPAIADPDFGFASVTASSSSPYLVYRVDFTGQVNCLIGLPISEIFITNDYWAEYPSIALNLKGWASRDGGAFELITELDHTFTELSQTSPPLFPDTFECNILEAYITLEFL